MLKRLFHRLLMGIAAFAVIYMVLSWLGWVTLYRLPTSSMEPTLQGGDHLLATKLTASGLERGALIIFDSRSLIRDIDPALHLKRLVALPGDVIDVHGNEILVNGTPLPTRGSPSLPQFPAAGYPPISYPLTVPKDHVYVVGDHYANSLDSRYYGPVPIRAIRMKPRFRTWPLGSFGPVH